MGATTVDIRILSFEEANQIMGDEWDSIREERWDRDPWDWFSYDYRKLLIQMRWGAQVRL